MLHQWHIFVLATLFFTAGVFHFIKPRIFMRIMPGYLPAHRFLVLVSGLLEILAAIGLLFTKTRVFSAWIIGFLLISFIPVHIHMIANKKAGLNLPKWILYLRLFLQAFLIYWAYQYV